MRPGYRTLWTWTGLGCLLLATIGPLTRAAPAPAGVTQIPHPRVISLVPALTEMLFAIGAGADVVGVSSYDTYPAEAASRPKVGALVDPDFERILTLRPDLVLVYGSQDDLVARLRRAGIGAYIYRHAGLSDITATLRELGSRVGYPVPADRLADQIDAGLAQVKADVAGRPRPRTALIFGREAGALRALYASGGVGFLHDLLVLAGGDDAFGDIRREGLPVSTEMLLARRPEVLLELRDSSGGWNSARLARERAVWRALPSLPAVRNDRVYILADSALTIPGPRVVASARAIAAVLHPR